jgi:hypothetical protein
VGDWFMSHTLRFHLERSRNVSLEPDRNLSIVWRHLDWSATAMEKSMGAEPS